MKNITNCIRVHYLETEALVITSWDSGVHSVTDLVICQVHIDLCHIRNCSTQGGVFLLEEFGKYLARLFTYDPVWNRLGTRFQEKERKKLLFCCSMSVGLRINRL